MMVKILKSYTVRNNFTSHMVNTTYAQSQGIIYYLLSFNPLKSKKKDLLLSYYNKALMRRSKPASYDNMIQCTL